MTKYTSSVVHDHFSLDVVHTDVNRLVNLIPRFREDHESRLIVHCVVETLWYYIFINDNEIINGW